MFTLDAGYSHVFFTNLRERDVPRPMFKADANELYIGVLADVLLSPSLYFFYCPEWQDFAIEGRVAYTYDLSQFGVGGAAVEFGAKLGYDSVDKPFGFKGMRTAMPDDKKAAVYYGANADLVYSFNEHAKARAGIELSGNGAKKGNWRNAGGQRGCPKTMVWFNASVDCSF
jgi:hypothetical protein